MILNIYTYKGPKNSLIGPWVSIGLLIESNADYENCVPNSKNIYNFRKSISKFDFLLTHKVDIRFSFTSDINVYGDYSILKAERSLIGVAKSLAYPNLITINKITKPTLWYERLCVIYSVYYRNEYIKRLSNEIDYLSLDKDFLLHVEFISKLKYLPPLYIWDRCIKATELIYPKPYWYKKELKEFYN